MTATTTSIEPRAFIPTPTISASLAGIPLIRPPRKHPNTFPIVAVMRKMTATVRICG